MGPTRPPLPHLVSEPPILVISLLVLDPNHPQLSLLPALVATLVVGHGSPAPVRPELLHLRICGCSWVGEDPRASQRAPGTQVVIIP